LNVNFENVTVIVLDCDRTMWQSLDDGVWPWSFASQFSFTEEFDLGVE
jgi:hypothetical protein